MSRMMTELGVEYVADCCVFGDDATWACVFAKRLDDRSWKIDYGMDVNEEGTVSYRRTVYLPASTTPREMLTTLREIRDELICTRMCSADPLVSP